VNHARHLHAGHLGHAEIDDNDVGLERSGFLNGFQTIYGLAADLPTLVRFEQFARATARLWVVVYYKNSSHSSLARFCKSAAMLGILHCVIPYRNTVDGVWTEVSYALGLRLFLGSPYSVSSTHKESR
jgi:hypothetical protein